MTLSEVLKEFRKKENISQRELARRCDLSNSLISILEMGENPQTKKKMSPDLQTYSRLAKGMRISLQSLFELLGNDASVALAPTKITKTEHGYESTFPNPNQAIQDAIDNERLEALHQDPRLGLLFDRTRKMSHDDVETMLAVAASILKAQDER